MHISPKEQEPLALINKVADSNSFKPTWFLGGICKAVYVNLCTMLSSTENKAKFVSRMLNDSVLKPQSLRWFSPKVIEKIRPAHPLDLAKGAVSTSDVAKRTAFGKAYQNCFEDPRKPGAFPPSA